SSASVSRDGRSGMKTATRMIVSRLLLGMSAQRARTVPRHDRQNALKPTGNARGAVVDRYSGGGRYTARQVSRRPRASWIAKPGERRARGGEGICGWVGGDTI